MSIVVLGPDMMVWNKGGDTSLMRGGDVYFVVEGGGL